MHINIQFKLLCIAFICFLSLNNANAVIFERKSLEEIFSLIDKDSIVFFDIDNTLIYPNQSLGSAEWYYSVYLSHIKENIPEKQARNMTQKEWYNINLTSKTSTVEPNTAEFISGLQKNGISVMGLTARPQNVSTLTKNQLLNNKIDLSKTAISKKSDVLIAGEIGYTRGILFVEDYNKGEAMLKLFSYFKTSPKKVVFIDDVQKNTDAVEAALTKANIPIISIRYSALDAKVKAYNPKIIAIEEEVFQKKHILISDLEAQKILANQ